MLNKEQAESVAEAILAPGRDAQVVARKKIEQQRSKIALQQYIAGFGLTGFAIGAIAGYILFDDIMPLCMGGTGLGILLGRFNQHRAAKLAP